MFSIKYSEIKLILSVLSCIYHDILRCSFNVIELQMTSKYTQRYSLLTDFLFLILTAIGVDIKFCVKMQSNVLFSRIEYLIINYIKTVLELLVGGFEN